MGSRRKGYERRPNNEPALDNAYKRYGEAPGKALANQFCTSGLVVERIKKGKPIARERNFTIARDGWPKNAEPEATLGVIGVGQEKAVTTIVPIEIASSATTARPWFFSSKRDAKK